MKEAVRQQLIRLNSEFYETFAAAFAATRRRIQPGVRKVLEEIPRKGKWLDLGCGSGQLALEWVKQKRKGAYQGLDFSAGLLAEADQTLRGVVLPRGLKVSFTQADLATIGWSEGLKRGHYDGVLAFAMLHHIPGEDQRLELMRQARYLLKPNGLFIHSEWQFQYSEKLMARRMPWEFAGLTAVDVEPGDTLMDWRYALPGQAEQVGYRYVHLFTRAELEELADRAGFEIADEFESDGEGGRLGIYQVWKVTSP
ncbi:MAG: class I SAM-dependent methyltransferase [Anaerolineaceae bacterium]|nr:class I SAM-dependent methyltransferase [Anaerolineaceae bacterium]